MSAWEACVNTWLGVAAGTFAGALLTWCFDEDGRPIPIASKVLIAVSLLSLCVAGWTRS